MAIPVTYVKLQNAWLKLPEIGGMRPISPGMVLVFDTHGGSLGTYRTIEVQRMLRLLSPDEGRDLMDRWSPKFDDHSTMLGSILKITAGDAPRWITRSDRKTG